MCDMNLPADDAASLDSHAGDDSSQASETSDTSEASSLGFRPVPRKRTFLSRHPGPDTPADPASVVPSPRPRRQVVQEDAASPADENAQQPLSDEDQPAVSESKHRGTPLLKKGRSVKVLNASAKALTTRKLKHLSDHKQRPGATLT